MIGDYDGWMRYDRRLATDEHERKARGGGESARVPSEDHACLLCIYPSSRYWLVICTLV
jgi:hypothetical protein